VPLPVGQEAIAAEGTPLPERVVAELELLDGFLLGPHDSASYPEPHRSALNPSGALRKRFDLYANVRPAAVRGGSSRYVEAADLVVVRENTEGFYADRNTFAGSGEWMPTADVAIAQGVFTRAGIERIARVACGLAAARSGHLTIVHKANVLPLTSGLFLAVCREVAAAHGGLEVDDFHMDAMTVHLLRRPADFDVIVAENMFGDILSDLAGELCGSLGIAGSLNFGDRHAMAQAAHGSAPDIAGRDLANPTGTITSAALLLRHLGLAEPANAVDAAVDRAISEGHATRDLGGSLGTRAFAEAVTTFLTR
jgi:3-isopropylmalate dehydrogenase